MAASTTTSTSTTSHFLQSQQQPSATAHSVLYEQEHEPASAAVMAHVSSRSPASAVTTTTTLLATATEEEEEAGVMAMTSTAPMVSPNRSGTTSSSSSTSAEPAAVLLREWRSESPPVAPAVVMMVADVVEGNDDDDNNVDHNSQSHSRNRDDEHGGSMMTRSAANATTATTTLAAASTAPVIYSQATPQPQHHPSPPNGSTAAATGSPYYSYPVATFVQQLVRTGMDHVQQLQHYHTQQQQQQRASRFLNSSHSLAEDNDDDGLPLSIRSEDHVTYAAAAAAAAAETSAAATGAGSTSPPHASARSMNDVLDFADAEAEFVLVDGDLIAIPPLPPNAIEQADIEARIRRQHRRAIMGNIMFPGTSTGTGSSFYHPTTTATASYEQPVAFVATPYHDHRLHHHPAVGGAYPHDMVTALPHQQQHLEQQQGQQQHTFQPRDAATVAASPPPLTTSSNLAPTSRVRRGVRKISKFFRRSVRRGGAGGGGHPHTPKAHDTNTAAAGTVIDSLSQQQQHQQLQSLMPPPADDVVDSSRLVNDPNANNAVRVTTDTIAAAVPSTALGSAATTTSTTTASISSSALAGDDSREFMLHPESSDDQDAIGSSLSHLTMSNSISPKRGGGRQRHRENAKQQRNQQQQQQQDHPSKPKRGWRRSDSAGHSSAAATTATSNDEMEEQSTRAHVASRATTTMAMANTLLASPPSLDYGGHDGAGIYRPNTHHNPLSEPRHATAHNLLSSSMSSTPALPPMSPILSQDGTVSAARTTTTSSTSANSVTASFVGTSDQLERGFILPVCDMTAAIEVIDEDSTMGGLAKKEDDDYYLDGSNIWMDRNRSRPPDTDYKVDKADAPDVEFMLRRAAIEASTDLEASAAWDNLACSSGSVMSASSSPVMTMMPHAPRRGKSDGTAVPLSESITTDVAVYNDMLKIVMVSAPDVNKSYVARALRNAAHRKPKKRTTLGVDVHTWSTATTTITNNTVGGGNTATIVNNQQQVTTFSWHFQIVDIQGASSTMNESPNFGAHPGTQSLFFSARSLYLLVWDLACHNRATYYRRARSRSRSKPARTHDSRQEESDNSDDDDDSDTETRNGGEDDDDDDDNDEEYEDDFVREEANRQADRILHADIHSRVLSWVDVIARRAPQSAILPVALIPADAPATLGKDEIQRRCNLLQSVLEQYMQQPQRFASAVTGTLPPMTSTFEFGGAAAAAAAAATGGGGGCSSVGTGGSSVVVAAAAAAAHAAATNFSSTPTLLASAADHVLCVYEATGRGIPALQDTVLEIATDSTQSVFDHVGTPVPRGTVLVLDAVKRFKMDHKLIRLDHLIGDLGATVAVEEIIHALHFLSAVGEIFYYGNGHDEILSRYIILSRKWFVSALSCILRNDLKRELGETRRFMNIQNIYNDQRFLEHDMIQALAGTTNSSSPLLSGSDAEMLWQSMTFMREAADRYSQLDESSTTGQSMFYFLERLLVHAGIFLPLGCPSSGVDSLDRSEVFFVPSLLAQVDPNELDVWTYKTRESWLTTLCYSWLFRDGAAPNLMEHITVGLLRDLYGFSRNFQGTVPRPDTVLRSTTMPGTRTSLHGVLEVHDAEALGRMRIRQVVCWKSSLLIKIGANFCDKNSDEIRESTVEIFVAVVDQSSAHCVASDEMRASMHRVIVSGKGEVGHHGRRLWKGGFQVCLESVRNSLARYPNVDQQVVCPECLAHRKAASASTWSWDSVLAVTERGNSVVRCMHGHRVDGHLICGSCDSQPHLKAPPHAMDTGGSMRIARPVPDLLPSVVLVGLWDELEQKIKNVGSGFVVDKKLGLIITAAHILFDMRLGTNFGKRYFGIRQAKAVIGVIPEDDDGGFNAAFRYFADIVYDDIHNVDACVLRLTTRLEQDVYDEGAGCAKQAEITLSPSNVHQEKLKSLKMTNRFELEETVRVLGFNQGGEGVLDEGKHVNRCADFAGGHICKLFKVQKSADDSSSSSESSSAHAFTPREEIVIKCRTIAGHSGGPCVNNEGKVLGILSRADPSDPERCYLVPSTELKLLVTKAKTLLPNYNGRQRDGPIPYRNQSC